MGKKFKFYFFLFLEGVISDLDLMQQKGHKVRSQWETIKTNFNIGAQQNYMKIAEYPYFVPNYRKNLWEWKNVSQWYMMGNLNIWYVFEFR